jgi:transposase
MEQRLVFIREYDPDLFTLTELATQYGISRKTAYQWCERYRVEGAPGLCDRSRRPHRSPRAPAARLVDAVVAERRRQPGWGATQRLAVLRRRPPRGAWPARATVCDLRHRQGLITAPATGARPGAPAGPPGADPVRE